MNQEVELIKDMDPEKVAAWDRLHDKRKTYRCHRCGAEWKCEYGANKMDKSYSYEKVIEFFSEHETAIYGLGPTDYGAEEGTLLWCIKELDNIYDCSRYFNTSAKEDVTALRDQILKVLCCLTDIYEEEKSEDSTAEWVDKEVRGSMTNVCSRCGADSIYPTKYCGNCGISMKNGY